MSSNEIFKWSCTACTYENWSSSSKCTLCGTLHNIKHNNNFNLNNSRNSPSPPTSSNRSSPPVKRPPPASNSSSSSNIFKMAAEKPAPIATLGAASAKWSCTACTYLNWAKAVKCVQCRTERSMAETNRSNRNSPSPPIRGQQVQDMASGGGAAVSSISELNRANNQASGRIIHNYQNNNYQHHIASPNQATSPKQQHHQPQQQQQQIDCNKKWSCNVCTYENWPRSKACVLCGSAKLRSPTPPNSGCYNLKSPVLEATILNARNTPSPPVVSSSFSGLAAISSSSSPLNSLTGVESPAAAAIQATGASSTANNNYDHEKKIRQLKRRLRDADWNWLTACMAVVEGDPNPVEAYLRSGGDPTRKLTNPEVVLLNRSNVYEAGHTLVHLAIRFHREDLLATLLSRIESNNVGGSGCSSSAGVIKCVPAYVAPDLGAAVNRHFAQILKQRKGDNFPCYFFSEWAVYSLPSEIEDLPSVTQEQLYSEFLDSDVQKELDGEMIINWSEELKNRLNSRLFALWNRSAGDCLLDSVLQATWGVFDKDNLLRRAMSDSLHEAATKFYPRWREWEIQQALEADYSLHESQLAADWASLLNIASQPGASLEHVHILCLAHVLRRPVVVYGVKYFKSWRGENLGPARFEGVYLPMLWEPAFCHRSPIALGYTRGHFSALVPAEPAPPPVIGAGGHKYSYGATANANCSNSAGSEDEKSVFLPLMSCDLKLLPIHFLNESEIGEEEAILRRWLDVAVTPETGLVVARQKIGKPPLLVAQMTEEWLNHYRKLAQSCIAPFNSRSTTSSQRDPPQANQQLQQQQQHQTTLQQPQGAGAASASSPSSTLQRPSMVKMSKSSPKISRMNNKNKPVMMTTSGASAASASNQVLEEREIEHIEAQLTELAIQENYRHFAKANQGHNKPASRGNQLRKTSSSYYNEEEIEDEEFDDEPLNRSDDVIIGSVKASENGESLKQQHRRGSKDEGHPGGSVVSGIVTSSVGAEVVEASRNNNNNNSSSAVVSATLVDCCYSSGEGESDDE